MSEPARDNLVALDPVAPAPEAIEAPPEDRRSRWIGILLGVALAVVSVLLVLQMRRADSLEAEVGRLAAELQASRQTVEAYKGHLDQVRGQVGDLSDQMQALQSLVESDPEAAGPPQDDALQGPLPEGEAL